jgi:hypothetical protein
MKCHHLSDIGVDDEAWEKIVAASSKTSKIGRVPPAGSKFAIFIFNKYFSL